MFSIQKSPPDKNRDRVAHEAQARGQTEREAKAEEGRGEERRDPRTPLLNPTVAMAPRPAPLE